MTRVEATKTVTSFGRAWPMGCSVEKSDLGAEGYRVEASFRFGGNSYGIGFTMDPAQDALAESGYLERLNQSIWETYLRLLDGDLT